MDSQTFAIIPGTKATVEVLHVRSDLAIVRFIKEAGEPIALVQIGAIEALPGYERQVAQLMNGAVQQGQIVHVTWIAGATADSLPRVSIHRGLIASPDVVALREGIALPTLHAPEPVYGEYRSSLEEAARLMRGGWGDGDLKFQMREVTQEVMGIKETTLLPTYFKANPGLGLILFIVILAVLFFAMREEHRAVDGQTQGLPPVKRAFRYVLLSNLRMLGGIFLPKRQISQDKKHDT